jgi:hypothetical protein
MIAAVNLAARFVLELAGVAALAYAGFQSTTSPVRWLAAVAAPTALIVFWAFIVAPLATNPIPLPAREVIGTLALLAAAAALAASGQPTPALILAVLTVVNNVLLVVLPEGTHVAEAVR